MKSLMSAGRRRRRPAARRGRRRAPECRVATGVGAGRAEDAVRQVVEAERRVVGDGQGHHQLAPWWVGWGGVEQSESRQLVRGSSMLQVPKEWNASRTTPARSVECRDAAATASASRSARIAATSRGRTAVGGVDGQDHVEEAVLLEAGRGVGVAHSVVQAGGGLERHPAARRPPRQRRARPRRGRGRRARRPCAASRGAGTDERGEQRGPAFVTRQLDVHLETGVIRDRGVQGRHHLRGIDPGRDGDLERRRPGPAARSRLLPGRPGAGSARARSPRPRTTRPPPRRGRSEAAASTADTMNGPTSPRCRLARCTTWAGTASARGRLPGGRARRRRRARRTAPHASSTWSRPSCPSRRPPLQE